MNKKGKFWIFTFIISIVVIGFVLLNGCSPNSISPSQQSKYQVFMINNTFSPQTISVPVGTEITWVNMDSVAHSVTCNMTGIMEGIFFDSGSIEPGYTYKRPFAAIGHFPYYCKYDPFRSMTGMVIVQ